MTTTPSTIVLIGPDQPGGVTSVLDSYRASALSERYRLLFVCTTGNGSRPRKLLTGAAALLRVVRLGLSRPRPLFHVHSASGWSFRRKAMFLLVIRLLGCPSILHIHSGGFIEWATGGGRSRRAAVKTVLRLPDSVVVLSPVWQKALAEEFGIGDATLVRNPVRVPHLPPSTTSRDMVLSTGRLIKIKGPRDLVEAAGVLQRRGRMIEFTLAGIGPELGAVKELAARLPDPGLVSTPGWMAWPGIERLLAECKVFCLPSHQEGLGLSLLEAMAAGVPCVATNVGGIPSFVTHEVTGLLVEPGKPEQLADAIEYLFDHPEEGRKMGRAGQQFVAANFGLQAAIADLETLYSRLGFPPDSGSQPPAGPSSRLVGGLRHL
jgi:glycosyltransferase involved in cell wall biosynthesis